MIELKMVLTDLKNVLKLEEERPLYSQYQWKNVLKVEYFSYCNPKFEFKGILMLPFTYSKNYDFVPFSGHRDPW